MKNITTLALVTLAALSCSGCASLSNAARSVGSNAVPIATGAAIAYFGGKDVIPHRTAPPSVPKSKPDISTADGGQVWLDKSHRVTHIKDLNDSVFEFTYKSKAGEMKTIVEPSGDRLTRDSSSSWTHHLPDSKKTKFYGTVTIGPRYEIRYTNRDGSQTIYNTNGYVVDLDRASGKDRVLKVTDTRGRTTEFGYDFDGKPFSVKTSDGFYLVSSDNGQWHRILPGTTWNSDVHYRVDFDAASSSITVVTASSSTTYGRDGVTQHDSQPQG